MRNTHTLSLLVCLTGLGSASCINAEGTGDINWRPDANIPIDYDADLTVIASANSELKGSRVVGTATFTARAAEVSGTVEVTLAPEPVEDDPEKPGLRGVRIMTGTSCDTGSEGAVWEFGDLGDMTIVPMPLQHIGIGELPISSADWTIGTGEASDIAGRALVIYSNTGDSGTIDSCGIIAVD